MWLVILFSVTGIALATPELERSVIVGTAENFDGVVSANEHILVEFYAPWCGHCKALEPEYAQAAETLADSGSAVKLMKVDVTKHEALAERFQVDGYPTLKWFVGEKPPVEYSGGRTASDIVAWIKKKTGPNPIPILSATDADTAKAENPVAAFGFFESLDSAEAQAFKAAADLSELAFYIVSDKSVADHLKVTTFPSIVLFTDFDEGQYNFAGEYDSSVISDWAVGNSLPLVMQFTEEAGAKIFDGPVKSHMILFVKKSSEKFDTLLSAMRESAPAYRGKLLYIWVDADDDNYGRILEFFGLSSKDLPAVRIISLESEIPPKFAPASGSDINAESLNTFATGYIDGTLTPVLKSQDVPDDWDAKPVKILTGKNFAEVALDDTKDVLVEFYAPWCGHCKQLAPIYDELAAAYEHDKSVVIAKVDATENEIPDTNIESFPTIYLYPKSINDSDDDTKSNANAASFKEYDGDRDLNAFLAYLKEQTGVAGKLGGSSTEDPVENGGGHEEL